MNTASSLVLSTLSFAYRPERWVLRDVALELRPGRLVCLVGPNGSGKSTLLRLAAGLLRPGAGTARFGGRDLWSWARLERARHVAFLPQTVTTLYRYDAREVVALGRHPHARGPWAGPTHADRSAIEDAMERTAVTEFARRPFDELSGGERQRVLIAAALAQGGDLLLLDEPTTALDLHHQVAVMGLLRELSVAGRTVLCATHDLNLAASFAHEAVLLERGTVVAHGRPEEVLGAESLGRIYGGGVWVGPHPAGPGIAVLPRPDRSGRPS